MTSIELENNMKQALKCFHCEDGDSTENLRIILDDLIRHAYGNNKTLGATLPLKYLDEEKFNAHRHRNKQQQLQQQQQLQLQQQQLQQDDEHSDTERALMDNHLSLELLQEDLTCAVCRQMSVQAGNRLVECEGCHALYHQDCHSPPITENQMNSIWNCSSCQVAAHSFSVSSMPPAKASLPIIHTNIIKSSPSKQPAPVNPSSSMKVAIPANSSSSSKVVTPNINIISADKRLQIMKKKAARQREIKNKHSK